MRSGLSRASACWLADHTLAVAGVALLVAGQVGVGWLTPLGWAAIGLAALGWLAESNGYAIPRPGRAPIASMGCGEVPVVFGVSRRGRHFLFTREVEQISDPWPSEYSVYELPSVSRWQACNGLGKPPADASGFNARVPVSELRFEHHERSYVDSASLGRALDRVVPRTV